MAKQPDGPPRPTSQYDHQRPTSQYDHQRMLSADGGGPGLHPKPLSQQMEAVSTPVLAGNDLMACLRLLMWQIAVARPD